MRLNAEQHHVILKTVAELAGVDAAVWLFGSRVDDAARGGDIDLLIDLPRPAETPAWLAASLSARLSRALDGRHVDVVLAAPNLKHLPIHEVALKEGVRL